LADLAPHMQLEYRYRTRGEIRRARKAEQELVNMYRGWLQAKRRTIMSLKYQNLQCDVYEKERGNLLEAKCSAAREYVRMAVGQLFEYAY
jgi:hypothetical protein